MSAVLTAHRRYQRYSPIGASARRRIWPIGG